jgi:hypothetical protein
VSYPENKRIRASGFRSISEITYCFFVSNVSLYVELGTLDGRITVNPSVVNLARHMGQGQGVVRSRYDEIYYITQSTHMAALQHFKIARLSVGISSKQIGQSSSILSSIFSSIDSIRLYNDWIAYAAYYIFYSYL